MYGSILMYVSGLSRLCLSLVQDILCLINMDDDHVPEHPDSCKSGTAVLMTLVSFILGVRNNVIIRQLCSQTQTD